MQLSPVILDNVRSSVKTLSEVLKTHTASMDVCGSKLSDGVGKSDGIKDSIDEVDNSSPEAVTSLINKINGVLSKINGDITSTLSLPVNTTKYMYSEDDIIVDSSGTWLKSGIGIFDTDSYPDATTGLAINPDSPLGKTEILDENPWVVMGDTLIEVHIGDSSADSWITAYDVITGVKTLDKSPLVSGGQPDDFPPSDNDIFMWDNTGVLELISGLYRYEINLSTLTVSRVTQVQLPFDTDWILPHPEGVLIQDGSSHKVYIYKADLSGPNNSTGHTNPIKTYSYKNFHKFGEIYLDYNGYPQDEYLQSLNMASLTGSSRDDMFVSDSHLMVRSSPTSISVYEKSVGLSDRITDNAKVLYIKVK